MERVSNVLWNLVGIVEPMIEVAGRVVEIVVGVSLAGLVVVFVLHSAGEPWARALWLGEPEVSEYAKGYAHGYAHGQEHPHAAAGAELPPIGD